jgi:hypothetical protein
MRRTSFRLIVGLITFAIGISAATYFINHRPREIPPPAVPSAPSISQPVTPSGIAIPSGWRKVELKDFSFYIPSDMKERKVRGTDSEIWEFRSKGITLSIDYGVFSPECASLDRPEYREERVVVDGRAAKVCAYRRSDKYDATYPEKDREYFTAINFPDVWGGDSGSRLTFDAACLDSSTQETAKRIFQTIKFTWPPSNNGMHSTATRGLSSFFKASGGLVMPGVRRLY